MEEHIKVLRVRHLFPTYPKRVLVQVRRLSFHHLDGHDTQRPNVYFRPISLSGHHLRSHPVGRAHHGAALALLWSNLGTEAKVGYGMEMESRSVKHNVTQQTNNQSAATSGWHSLSLTEPSIPSRTLSLLMSLWMTWLAWRKSKACKHCTGGRRARRGKPV